MRTADLWPPLQPFGAEVGQRIERALGGAPPAEIERLLTGVDLDPLQQAAAGAARFALALRSGGLPTDVDQIGRKSQEGFACLGEARSVAFLQAERAVGLLSDKALASDAARLLDDIRVDPDDFALQAAVDRGRGAVARSQADLRGSLLHLERARILADRSGHPREIVRTLNTLGTSYAALGISSLARESLERARELAELAGQHQSAAIAAGQLATLAFETENYQLAARHLKLQKWMSELLGDLHGQARSSSLLVEAYGALHELTHAYASAEDCRKLYERAPSPWTRMQAAMATLYEAELALACGEEERADELLASCQEERESLSPTFRVVRARGALAQLWKILRTPHLQKQLASRIEDAFLRLARSPRPIWVERALGLAIDIAQASGQRDLVATFALRRASLIELRAAAASGALLSLRELAPEAAISRAMSLGQELVFQARLALGPLSPFEAEWIEIHGCPLEDVLPALSIFGLPGELPDALLISNEGSSLQIVLRDQTMAEQVCQRLRLVSGCIFQYFRKKVKIDTNPSLRLTLRCMEQ